MPSGTVNRRLRPSVTVLLTILWSPSADMDDYPLISQYIAAFIAGPLLLTILSSPSADMKDCLLCVPSGTVNRRLRPRSCLADDIVVSFCRYG